MSNTMNGIYWKGMVKCGFSDTGMLNRCSQLVGGDKDMVKVLKYNGQTSSIINLRTKYL